jgi:TIR domain
VIGPTPRASITEERQALLMLDAGEMTGKSPAEARTGLQLPEATAQRAFLMAIRHRPSFVKEVSSEGLRRAVIGLLRESHISGLRLEPISQSQDLWLVHAGDDTHAPMLLSVIATKTRVGIQIVDRINGVRDRLSSPKAVIVTRSYFTSDVTRRYGALSERMELVDYDRLFGTLSDVGWTAQNPGFLTCPVANRPKHCVFISYSRLRRDFAVWLYNKLHGWGYDCFLDDISMKAGEVILSAISKAIEGVDAVLLCCSTESLGSTWVAAEIEYALKKEERRKRTILIPLDMDGALSKKTTRPELRDRLSVNFRDWRRTGDWSAALRKVRDAVDNAISA